MKTRRPLRLTQLSILQLVRKPLPPAVRVFKDARRKNRGEIKRFALDIALND